MPLDYRIFYFINKTLVCRFLDFTMPAVTYLGDKIVLAASLLALSIFFKRKFRRASLLSLASLAVAVGLVKVLKDAFARPRPAGVLSDARMLGDFGLTHSFPSGHATFAFAVAFVFAAKYPKWKYTLLAAAALVGFSRIYIGAHFPSDALAGALLGSAVGLAAASVERRITSS